MICYANPKAYVQYKLSKEPQALVFSVLDQSPIVSAFLSGNAYQAQNGLTIRSSHYPEFKDSRNTIYLMGDSAPEDNFSSDMTTFSSNYVRDNKYDLVVNAIQEMVDFLNGKPIKPTHTHGQFLNIPDSSPGLTNFRGYPGDDWNLPFVCKAMKPKKVKRSPWSWGNQPSGNQPTVIVIG